MQIRKDYERLFANSRVPEPPATLLDSIFSKIAAARGETRMLKIKIGCFSLLSLLAATALIPAAREFGGEFSRSGLLEFGALLISDFSLALLYWKELSLSILESLPVFGTAAVAMACFTLFSSLRFLALDFRMLETIPKLANPSQLI